MMGHVKHLRKPGYWPSGSEVWGLAIGQKLMDGCHGCTANQKATFGRKFSKLVSHSEH